MTTVDAKRFTLKSRSGELRLYPTGYKYSEAHYAKMHDGAIWLIDADVAGIEAWCAKVLEDGYPWSSEDLRESYLGRARQVLSMMQDGPLPTHGDQWYLSSLHGRVDDAADHD